MKSLKIVAAGVLALILLLWGISTLMTSEYHVRRQIVINAPAKEVFSYINTLENWNYWSPWLERDPKMKITFNGPPSGAGATQTWHSETMGSGSLRINEIKENKSISYVLTINGFKSPSRGVIKLDSVKEGTLVTWTDSGDLGPSPVSKYFKIIMNNMIGSDFEQGLKNLKIQVEKRQM